MGLGQFSYANNSNRFLAVPELAAQPFAVVGVPFDGAVTHRPGARFGPQEIRRASLMLCDGSHPFFGVSPIGHLGDALDMRLPNAPPLAVVRQQIQAQAAQPPLWFGLIYAARWPKFAFECLKKCPPCCLRQIPS